MGEAYFTTVTVSTEKGCTSLKHTLIYYGKLLFYPRKESRIPAATAEPITPATLGPMACISKKLPGLAS